MIPPRSPYSLIQEDLWPNEWLILVSCVLLNCTSRRQVEKVWPDFRRLSHTPETLLVTDKDHIVNTIKSLGFASRRTSTLLKLAQAYLSNGWVHARELPGIGKYGSRAWEIFVKGFLGDQPPRDGALEKYWRWAKQNGALCVSVRTGVDSSEDQVRTNRCLE
jgi:methyl-CpG-binding domain protein 4